MSPRPGRIAHQLSRCRSPRRYLAGETAREVKASRPSSSRCENGYCSIIFADEAASSMSAHVPAAPSSARCSIGCRARGRPVPARSTACPGQGNTVAAQRGDDRNSGRVLVACHHPRLGQAALRAVAASDLSASSTMSWANGFTGTPLLSPMSRSRRRGCSARSSWPALVGVPLGLAMGMSPDGARRSSIRRLNSIGRSRRSPTCRS